MSKGARPCFLLLGVLCIFVGCQTAQQKNLSLLADRVEKLKPLGEWKSAWCEVDVELTEPAKARFSEMFPEESRQLSRNEWAYMWKARENQCEVTPLDVSPAAKSQKEFLDTAFCLLLQVHYVNSPFDELQVEPSDVVSVKSGVADSGEVVATSDVVHIQSGADKDLGIYLPRDQFVVETRTKSRGLLVAEYSNFDGRWLPARLEQRRGNTLFTVEDLQYSADVNGRRMLESFWISVGAEKALRQSQVKIKNCRAP